MMLLMYNQEKSDYLELPITPRSTFADVMECCRNSPSEKYCIVEFIHDREERVVSPHERPFDLMWGKRNILKCRFAVYKLNEDGCYTPYKGFNNDDNNRRRNTLSNLENFISDREVGQQNKKVAAMEERLKQLKLTRKNGDSNILTLLQKAEVQERRINQLRQQRGCDPIRPLFNKSQGIPTLDELRVTFRNADKELNKLKQRVSSSLEKLEARRMGRHFDATIDRTRLLITEINKQNNLKENFKIYTANKESELKAKKVSTSEIRSKVEDLRSRLNLNKRRDEAPFRTPKVGGSQPPFIVDNSRSCATGIGLNRSLRPKSATEILLKSSFSSHLPVPSSSSSSSSVPSSSLAARPPSSSSSLSSISLSDSEQLSSKRLQVIGQKLIQQENLTGQKQQQQEQGKRKFVGPPLQQNKPTTTQKPAVPHKRRQRSAQTNDNVAGDGKNVGNKSFNSFKTITNRSHDLFNKFQHVGLSEDSDDNHVKKSFFHKVVEKSEDEPMKPQTPSLLLNSSKNLGFFHYATRKVEDLKKGQDTTTNENRPPEANQVKASDNVNKRFSELISKTKGAKEDVTGGYNKKVSVGPKDFQAKNEGINLNNEVGRKVTDIGRGVAKKESKSFASLDESKSSKPTNSNNDSTSTTTTTTTTTTLKASVSNYDSVDDTLNYPPQKSPPSSSSRQTENEKIQKMSNFDNKSPLNSADPLSSPPSCLLDTSESLIQVTPMSTTDDDDDIFNVTPGQDVTNLSDLLISPQMSRSKVGEPPIPLTLKPFPNTFTHSSIPSLGIDDFKGVSNTSMPQNTSISAGNGLNMPDEPKRAVRVDPNDSFFSIPVPEISEEGSRKSDQFTESLEDSQVSDSDLDKAFNNPLYPPFLSEALEQLDGSPSILRHSAGGVRSLRKRLSSGSDDLHHHSVSSPRSSFTPNFGHIELLLATNNQSKSIHYEKINLDDKGRQTEDGEEVGNEFENKEIISNVDRVFATKPSSSRRFFDDLPLEHLEAKQGKITSRFETKSEDDFKLPVSDGEKEKVEEEEEREDDEEEGTKEDIEGRDDKMTEIVTSALLPCKGQQTSLVDSGDNLSLKDNNNIIIISIKQEDDESNSEGNEPALIIGHPGIKKDDGGDDDSSLSSGDNKGFISSDDDDDDDDDDDGGTRGDGNESNGSFSPLFDTYGPDVGEDDDETRKKTFSFQPISESSPPSTNLSATTTTTSTATTTLTIPTKGILKKPGSNKLKRSSRVIFNPLAILLDAALQGELDVVKEIINKHGNSNMVNDEGITALHNSICAGHSDIARFLIISGCDVNAADSDLWTPLHCASSCYNLELVRFLVENGACVFATTESEGETALEKCDDEEEDGGECRRYLGEIQSQMITQDAELHAAYDSQPLKSDELHFIEGDILIIIDQKKKEKLSGNGNPDDDGGDSDDDNDGDEVGEGWWMAKNKRSGLVGYVPRNYLAISPRVTAS